MTTITPRKSLTHNQVFNEWCIKSRIEELIKAFMSKLEHEERKKLEQQQFKEAIEKGEIPKFKWRELSQGERYERYHEKAEKEAWKILEQERKNYVESKSAYIKKTLQQIIKRLRFMVYTVDAKGNPQKVKIYIERVNRPDHKGEWQTRDIMYVEDYDFERLDQINRVRARLNEFRDYVPYFNDELCQLWREASDLANLEIVRKEKKENA